MHMLAMLLQDNQPNPQMIQHMVMAMMAIIPIIMVVTIAIFMVPCWFICKKAGFSPWLCSVVPDSFAGHAGAALCSGVCRVEGRTGTARCLSPAIPAAAATLSTAGVRQLT